MSAWVLVLVFAFLDGGTTSVVIDMANYQACATAEERVRRATQPVRIGEAETLRLAVCLERQP